MPLLHALYLAIAVLAIAAATSRRRIHPFLAVAAASAGFAYASGMSVSLLGKVFGTGFGQTVNTLGLPVLAACMIGAMAERSHAAASLMVRSARWPSVTRSCVLACLGLAGGTGASAGGAYAVLGPLRDALSQGSRRRGAIAIGLAIAAGQGLLLPSPVVIAATAILAASWVRVLAIGLPVALLVTAASAMLAARMAADDAPAAEPGAAPASDSVAPASGGVARASAVAALTAACLIMAAMLAIQSIGDIPSEPLGGGGARETILGFGRPLVVFITGVAIMAIGSKAWRADGFSETGWPAQAIARAAPLMLLLGAAGGLQALAQNSHMSELLAERVLPWTAGLAVPFLAAAIMKTLQGSSLVAAITAAGMAQPLLATLGLDGETGRALAVLAVGAGSVTASHMNDGLFWLIADAARLRPALALATVTGLTALQGLLAILALMGIRVGFAV